MKTLQNNTRVSELKVFPKNWEDKKPSLTKPWYIHYRYYDKDYPKGRLILIKGMNKESTLEGRRAVTRKLLEFHRALHNNINGDGFIMETKFIEGLREALSKIKGVKGTLSDMRSVVDGVEKAAKKLGYNNLPIQTVTRKYIKQILETCVELNPRFSPARYNKYRAYLLRLYKELIEMEAVETNPIRDIKKEREVKTQRIMPTMDERRLINEHLKKYNIDFWRFVQIFFHSGSREIELLNVQVKDVDLENQRVKYLTKKGTTSREIFRPIVDSALPLWMELIKDAPKNHYIFSKGLIPGETKIGAKQVSRRWANYVKGKTYHKGRNKAENDPTKLYLNIDLYTLKHLNTTEVMDELESIEETMKLTGHRSGAMIKNIYDKNYKSRKDDKIKKVSNKF